MKVRNEINFLLRVSLIRHLILFAGYLFPLFTVQGTLGNTMVQQIWHHCEKDEPYQKGEGKCIDGVNFRPQSGANILASLFRYISQKPPNGHQIVAFEFPMPHHHVLYGHPIITSERISPS